MALDSSRNRATVAAAMLLLLSPGGMAVAGTRLAPTLAHGQDDLMTLRYNNDLTNILIGTSPATINLTRQLEGSVAETASLRADSVSLAPGFCMIPWWKSERWPLATHVKWWTTTFDTPVSRLCSFLSLGTALGTLR